LYLDFEWGQVPCPTLKIYKQWDKEPVPLIKSGALTSSASFLFKVMFWPKPESDLDEGCFSNINSALVAGLHSFFKSEDIGNMVHNIELGAGNFAFVEIGIEVVVA